MTAPPPEQTAAQPGRQGARGGRRVRDLMTPNPETVETNTDAATAAERMRSLDVGVLPVMADGRLAGIITDRDIALGVSVRQRPPSEIRVGELMTEVPVTITPDASVDEAVELMASNKIRRLPVIEGARLVGMLSLGDLAAEGAERPAAGALKEISEPASPET